MTFKNILNKSKQNKLFNNDASIKIFKILAKRLIKPRPSKECRFLTWVKGYSGSKQIIKNYVDYCHA